MMEIVKSALLVTENEILIQQLNDIFLKNNYSLYIEKSKIKSILKLLQQEINLIMIYIDGSLNFNLELIDIIKRTRPRLPIIILSNDSTVETLRDFIQAGVFYYALKPIDDDEIYRLLETVGHVNKLHGNIRNSCHDHFRTKNLMYN